MTYNDSSHLCDDPVGNCHITSSCSHHHPQPQVPTTTLSRPWQIPTSGQATQVDTTITTSTATATASPTPSTWASCITHHADSLFAPPLIEGCGHSQPLPRCHVKITIDMLLTWVSLALSKIGVGYIPVVR